MIRNEERLQPQRSRSSAEGYTNRIFGVLELSGAEKSFGNYVLVLFILRLQITIHEYARRYRVCKLWSFTLIALLAQYTTRSTKSSQGALSVYAWLPLPRHLECGTLFGNIIR
jgi:hypothetical protein